MAGRFGDAVQSIKNGQCLLRIALRRQGTESVFRVPRRKKTENMPYIS
jgi:hypothetical protein